MQGVFRIAAMWVLGATVFVAGAIGLPEPDRRREAPLLEGGFLFRRGSPMSTARTIATLQDRLRDEGSDWRAAAALGHAYVQQARITADPSSYPLADESFRLSLSLRPDNVEAVVGLGSLALARHDFREALDWGRLATTANPHGTEGYGVIGDALVELGRYRQAFRAFQRMANLRPGLSAYARASYARELQGDVAGAIRLMKMARQAAGSPENAAWAAFELGELYWSTGRLLRAEASYRLALRWAPNFLPPRAGLARVSFARGRLNEAIRRYRRVVARFPAPEHVAALGDLYVITGRPGLAEEQYALVRAERRLFQANGVNLDLEAALFDADHGRPGAALGAARAAWSERKSVHAADALAWTLFKNGRYGEASKYARRSLRLGTSSPLFLFHAGMIELRLGHQRRARRLLEDALGANPGFSILHSETARRALSRLVVSE